MVPVLSGLFGGTYQYSLNTLLAMQELSRIRESDEYVVFADDPVRQPVLQYRGPRWSIQPAHPPSTGHQQLNRLRRWIGEGPHREAWRIFRRVLDPWSSPFPNPDRIRFKPERRDWFKRFAPDLMIYPVPDVLSFETGLPYVMAIHDLQHRLQPDLPEFRVRGEIEKREYLFRNGVHHALLLLADSETGREDILRIYGSLGVKADRVRVLPFLPASYLSEEVPDTELARVRQAYRLPERYLYYPAHFWPHKNHIRLIEALGLLKSSRSLRIPLVLCGDAKGPLERKTLQSVKRRAAELHLDSEVRYLGFVPDADMSALYAAAEALVMPTLFGPTNIPILEAWKFGCPVLTSDLRGIREQSGDAAVLADPFSVEAIADGIHRVWTDPSLRARVAEAGHRRLASYTPTDYRERLWEVIDEARRRIARS